MPLDIQLTGNVAVEIEALLELYQRRVCLFMPASPDRGYTTINGP